MKVASFIHTVELRKRSGGIFHKGERGDFLSVAWCWSMAKNFPAVAWVLAKYKRSSTHV